MFRFDNKKVMFALLMAYAVICMPSFAFAAETEAFKSLTKAGTDIFQGLREIIYPASAVGIIAVCIGGFFGNINWKWLTAIVIGLIVISCCVGLVSMFAPEAATVIPKGSLDGK